MHLIKRNFLFQKTMALCIQIQNLTEIHYATPIFWVFNSWCPTFFAPEAHKLDSLQSLLYWNHAFSQATFSGWDAFYSSWSVFFLPNTHIKKKAGRWMAEPTEEGAACASWCLCILWCNIVPARTWSHNRMVHRSSCGSHKLRSIGCEQVVDPMFWWGPNYITRCTGVRSRAVQVPGDIVGLAIVLSVVPSFKSFHFQQDVLLDAVRLMCAAQPGFSASSTTHVCKALPRC